MTRSGTGVSDDAAVAEAARGSAGRLIVRRVRQLLFGRPLADATDAVPPLPPGRLVRVPGRGEIFVRDQPGPDDALPVVLLHGWFASAELNWFGAFGRFEGERRVLAVDHRGHGRGIHPVGPFTLEDCAEDVAALLHELQVPRALVVGFSMGGPIGMLLARRHPDVVAGLVVASTAAVFATVRVERWRWRLIRVIDWGLRLGLGDRLVARLASEWGRVDPAFAPYGGWLVAEFTRATPRVIREAGTALSRFDARPWLDELSMPTASVVTGDDSLVPPSRQEALARALGAPVERLDGVDHDAPIAAVDRFGAAIHSAVDRVAAAYAQDGHVRQRPS
jgi:3-oxoadipate enol-lactonase